MAVALRKGHTLTCEGVDYQLVESVGAGGAGEVWLAEAQARRWAVKLLKPGADSKTVERFGREASFQMECPHDGIARVAARGEHDGRSFYIMPYYPDTLRGVISRGSTDNRTLLSFLRQIGEALQFAHEHGIVHRDLKPENVLIEGEALVLADFGIAHFTDSSLTSAGDLVGNRDYRAPEQRKGRDAREVDQAADVYALGLIINECFTRDIPAGSSYRTIEASHPLMSYLDLVVSRMLAQDPNNRPAIIDVLTDLRFFEAKQNDEIDDISEELRLEAGVPTVSDEKFDTISRQASEDIWFAANLIASKVPEELKLYNANWHMRMGYDASQFLRSLCVQSRLIDLCQRKFDYESRVYGKGRTYKALDVDGDLDDKELYGQARALVLAHPLPPRYDLSGRILKTFASCADYHCEELLSDGRRVVAEVDENLLGAPILWIVQYLAIHVPNIMDVEDIAAHFRINWTRSVTFEENDDDSELLTRTHLASDPEPVLEALRESWDVSITRIGDQWCSVMFRTAGEYGRFREHALGLAEPQSLFGGDVASLFREQVCAGGIIELRLDLTFDVCHTVARVLGLRHDS